jgi:hypothetical protein
MQTSSDGLTRFLATWGAIVASVGLGWNIYRDAVDRAKLQLSARIRRMGYSTTGQSFFVAPDMKVQASEELYLVMSVVNIGRRPVVWQGWGGKYYKPQEDSNAFFVFGRNLPKMLQEGESHAEWGPFSAKRASDLENTKKIYVWAAGGKEWALSRKQLKELKEEARQVIEKK